MEIGKKVDDTIYADFSIEELLKLVFQKGDKRVEIKNIEVSLKPIRTEGTISSQYNYRYSYSTFFEIKFDGKFGENPEVLLVYSKDDTPINFDERESIEVVSLKKNTFLGNTYTYFMPKEYIYYSNNSQVLKEYVFIIFSKQDPSRIGFVVALVADKRVAQVGSYGEGLGGAISTSFNPLDLLTSIPNVKYKGSWPKKLSLSSTYLQNGQQIKLKESNIEAIIDLENRITGNNFL
ncbi:hypothetical protein [Streptococcus ruminantium]|uniref:hypothetical protein n=1 Tax=Streptococcus ruminantium TaxID=1917441 RepID=UPI0012DCEF55|nr:hypothetical protein [Streptococcus ruminantium]